MMQGQNPAQPMAPAPAMAQDSATISKPRRRTQADFIEGVVRTAVTGGAKDLSMQELKDLLARSYDMRMDLNVISRVVHELVATDRLVRRVEDKRACSLSKATVQPFTVPVVQARMFS